MARNIAPLAEITSGLGQREEVAPRPGQGLLTFRTDILATVLRANDPSDTRGKGEENRREYVCHILLMVMHERLALHEDRADRSRVFRACFAHRARLQPLIMKFHSLARDLRATSRKTVPHGAAF